MSCAVRRLQGSAGAAAERHHLPRQSPDGAGHPGPGQHARGHRHRIALGAPAVLGARDPDRKSTRLNSSHLVISYAVFCLKKKNTDPSLAHTLIIHAYIVSTMAHLPPYR